MRSFEIQENFKVPAEVIYNAWLNSEEHTEMTGGEAHCSPEVGGSFNTWDGYISGKNIELEDGKKIVQSWRTTQFREEDADSKIVVELKNTDGGCLLKLTHQNIPDEQTDYEGGWKEYYFEPMKAYFGS